MSRKKLSSSPFYDYVDQGYLSKRSRHPNKPVPSAKHLVNRINDGQGFQVLNHQDPDFNDRRMNLAILLVFAVLNSVSCVNNGEKGLGTPAGNVALTITSVKSAAYDTMSNIKLYRELRRKQKVLAELKLQLQHLYDRRQEKINKLNGLPSNHNIPVKILPVACIHEVNNLIAYRANIPIVDSINPFNRKKNKLNNPHGNVHQNINPSEGYGGAYGYQPNHVGSSTSYYSQPTASSSARPGVHQSGPAGIYPTAPPGIRPYNTVSPNQPTGYGGKTQGSGNPQSQYSTYAKEPGFSAPPVQSGVLSQQNYNIPQNWQQKQGFN